MMMKRSAIFLILASATAFAGPLTKPYQDFVDACTAAFDSSSGGPDNIGKVICPCTAEESKHQGVTVPELKKETAEIRKTSSYKIRNKKLLAAFHYCTINLMEEADHPSQ